MKYGSVCSGVEAATAAWHPLGWEPQWFSEIEKFPSAVLDHHYPDVPNYGDMTKFKEWNVDTIDLLVGGTPCQSFSIAGLRKGLEDPRGNLMLTYLAMAAQLKPKWLVWENVPGVLSSNGGKDFGTFLSALGQIGYGFAYRVLDAQYFGLAQRRKRVFVVGYLGDWRRAAAVLFEPESLSGHPAPSRETGEEVAQCLTTRTGSAYDPTTETLPIAFPTEMSGTQAASAVNLSPTLSVKHTVSVSAPTVRRLTPTELLPAAMAFQQNTRDEVRYIGGDGKIAGALAASAGMKQTNYIQQSFNVRRLTPTECERLQGFPDGYTQIPWRNKVAENCPDGPRYKAMGNSMAVPVMRWIGERIQKTYST